eukprot:895721-Pleurochrysis_carterae.AAC.1
MFDWDALAHRFCVAAVPDKCVTQLLVATPVQLMPGDGATADGDNHSRTHNDADSDTSKSSDAEKCFSFSSENNLLSLLDCAAEPRTLWEHDGVSGEFHLSHDKSLCLDYFHNKRAYGVWRCHHIDNERFTPRPEAPAVFCVPSEPALCVHEAAAQAVHVHASGHASCL